MVSFSFLFFSFFLRGRKSSIFRLLVGTHTLHSLHRSPNRPTMLWQCEALCRCRFVSIAADFILVVSEGERSHIEVRTVAVHFERFAPLSLSTRRRESEI